MDLKSRETFEKNNKLSKSDFCNFISKSLFISCGFDLQKSLESIKNIEHIFWKFYDIFFH
jgi:hypothetical protein